MLWPGPWAAAQPPAVTDPTLAPWFRSLHQQNPDGSQGMSCCDTADGKILADNEWRVAGDGYEVRIGGEWRPVPPDTVLQHVPNPTGGAVLFSVPGGNLIFCFIRPTEG